MVSIIEIVLYTKPTAEHQYRVLPSSCHSLYTIPWEYDVYVPSTIQRIHTITYTHTSDSTTRIPLVVGYHLAIRSISSIFHKHIYILSSSQLAATLFKYTTRYLSTYCRYVDFPFGTRTLDSCYGVIRCWKSYISQQDRRERAIQAAILTGSSFNYLKGGGWFGNPQACSLGTDIWIQLQNGCQWN